MLWSCNECRPPTVWPFTFQHLCSSFPSPVDLAVQSESLIILPGGLQPPEHANTCTHMQAHTHAHTSRCRYQDGSDTLFKDIIIPPTNCANQVSL